MMANVGGTKINDVIREYPWLMAEYQARVDTVAQVLSSQGRGAVPTIARATESDVKWIRKILAGKVISLYTLLKMEIHLHNIGLIAEAPTLPARPDGQS